MIEAYTVPVHTPTANQTDGTTTPNDPPEEDELGTSALQSVPTIKKASIVSIVTRSSSDSPTMMLAGTLGLPSPETTIGVTSDPCTGHDPPEQGGDDRHLFIKKGGITTPNVDKRRLGRVILLLCLFPRHFYINH